MDRGQLNEVVDKISTLREAVQEKFKAAKAEYEGYKKEFQCWMWSKECPNNMRPALIPGVEFDEEVQEELINCTPALAKKKEP